MTNPVRADQPDPIQFNLRYVERVLNTVRLELYEPASLESMPLDEIRRFRAHVYYDKGRRPEFKSGPDGLVDGDETDERSHHLVVRKPDGSVTGCVRITPVTTVASSALATHLGVDRTARVMADAIGTLADMAELGRWAVAKDSQRLGLGTVATLAAAAACRRIGRPVLWVTVGTRDRQHELARRLGARIVPGSIRHVEKYDDEVCVVNIDIRELDPVVNTAVNLVNESIIY